MAPRQAFELERRGARGGRGEISAREIEVPAVAWEQQWWAAAGDSRTAAADGVERSQCYASVSPGMVGAGDVGNGAPRAQTAPNSAPRDATPPRPCVWQLKFIQLNLANDVLSDPIKMSFLWF